MPRRQADHAGNRTAEQIDDDVRQAGYDTMNRLTSQGPGGALFFSGTLNEAATVMIAGKSATVAADNTFSGKASVPSGTSNVDIVAKDYAGNQRTSTYQVTQSASARTLTYDANGNMTSDGSRTFEWDAENRLLAVESGTHRSEFTYDGQSRRVRIVEKDNGSTTSDHWFLWCVLTVCEERDSTGATAIRRFFAEGEQQGITGYFYTRDHLGSVRELTDTAGLIRARYDYQPYGQRVKLGGDAETQFGFTGHFTHGPTNLILAPYRAYEPLLGNWLSEDPIGLAGGTNLYGYVNARPVNMIDPLGKQGIGPTLTTLGGRPYAFPRANNIPRVIPRGLPRQAGARIPKPYHNPIPNEMGRPWGPQPEMPPSPLEQMLERQGFWGNVADFLEGIQKLFESGGVSSGLGSGAGFCPAFPRPKPKIICTPGLMCYTTDSYEGA